MKKTIATAVLSLSMVAAASAATKAPPLVDVNWVKANGCKPDVVLLDIRSSLDGGSKMDYIRGHIPCAIYSDYMKGGWRTKVDNVPGMLPPVPQIAKMIGSLGIDNSKHVVIYSAGTNATSMGSATRVYWEFKVLGDDNVSVMNGGYAAYTADKKNRLETGWKTPTPATFTAHFRKDMYATEADVERAMKEHVLLVDNRPSDQYLGVNRIPAAKRNGTIPGAKNLPETWLTENDGGTFRSVSEIRKLYAAQGIATRGKEINFCNTGHWASLGWFASHELLGNKQAELYDGSMVQWSADAKAPMQQKLKVQ